MLMKESLLTAVQGQPGAVITPTVPLLAPAGITWLEGEIEKMQMGRVKLLVATCPEPSVTCTVKLNVPVFVGVPLIDPTGDNESPVGSVPSVSLQVNEGTPPETWSVCRYCSPMTGKARELVKTSIGEVMAIVRVLEVNSSKLSSTATEKVKIPTAVGVPLIVPVAEDSVSPGGSFPELIDQRISGKPAPATVSVSE